MKNKNKLYNDELRESKKKLKWLGIFVKLLLALGFFTLLYGFVSLIFFDLFYKATLLGIFGTVVMIFALMVDILPRIELYLYYKFGKLEYKENANK